MIIHGHTSIDLPTLVLNKSWYPIDAVTVRDAMCGIMAERAKVSGLSSFRMHSGDEDYDLYDADEWLRLPLLDNEPYIQATHQRIRIPEVIINRHHKVPSRDVKFSRINLWKRDSWTCQYCGKMPENDEITIDHVVPRSRGGKTTFRNTVLACVACNKKKNDRTPEEAGMPLRRSVRNKKTGLVSVEHYHRPSVPKWNPIYSIRRKKMPVSWGKFIQELINNLYWHIELQE